MYNDDIKKRLNEATATLNRIKMEIEAVGVRPTDRARIKAALRKVWNLVFEEKTLETDDDGYEIIVDVLRRADQEALADLAFSIEFKL